MEIWHLRLGLDSFRFKSCMVHTVCDVLEITKVYHPDPKHRDS